MAKFRKKPVVIEAAQWDGKMTTVEPLLARSTVTEIGQDFLEPDLIIPTLEGEMRAKVGDWIILGVAGELYPCKPDIFEATYEPAEDT
jgi:hypothetical protein